LRESNDRFVISVCLRGKTPLVLVRLSLNLIFENIFKMFVIKCEKRIVDLLYFTVCQRGRHRLVLVGVSWYLTFQIFSKICLSNCWKRLFVLSCRCFAYWSVFIQFDNWEIIWLCLSNSFKRLWDLSCLSVCVGDLKS